MAMKSRTCEQCGGKSSPHIPRQRMDGKLLCQGCAAVALARTASKVDGTGAHKKPQGEQQQFDFWDGDLAPREDMHPLQQPLPNSVWERFALHRKLLGKPKVFLSDHLDEAEERGGDSDPIPGSKDDKIRRQRRKSSLVRTAAELEHPVGPEETKQHLQKHHGFADWETDLLGDDEDSLKSAHEHEHTSTATNPNHSHADGIAEKETVGDSGSEGLNQLKHPSKFTNSSLHTHLLVDHGIDPDHMENAIDGTFEGTDNSHIVHMLHNAAHKNGQMEHAHEHEGWSGPPWVHPGHKDVGKPFWGAPPNTVGKTLTHLAESPENGGHGIPHEELPNVASLSDEDAKDVLAEHHGDLHDIGGANLSHQHVPTAVKGVKTPKQIKKDQLTQHLKEHHGIGYVSGNPEMQHSELHDPEAYAYQKPPSHEHAADDPHGAITQSLPDKPTHFEHGSNMSHQDLLNHMLMDHKGWKGGQKPTGGDFTKAFLDFSDHFDSHEQSIQKHALMHASGESSPHTHEPMGVQNPLEDVNAHYGHEPEIQTDTHPHVGTDSEALAHIIKHHPNVTSNDLNDWANKGVPGGKPSMVKFHDALHTPGTTTAIGNKLPPVLDGHDHEDPVGVPTTIAVGHHLVHEHGMNQSEVASMTPEQFKSHHEQLHLKDSEFDVGHGHDYPGGPMRDPRVTLPNTHHMQFRGDDKHPAVNEWYHGTSTEYEGAPKNATELKNDHDMWGNFGAGDWNNHIGSHWTSLHKMAANFNGSGNRVIHAKLHISNPVTYNSLNHMSHDAYDRLHESGHLQDDGAFYKNHHDDLGYDSQEGACCSNRLLEYAKGHHRDDGKFGVEAYRDSLRASGYDGIHVRNQADNPEGHWNAIPLSADQIEITHGGCRGEHGDERDNDSTEFTNNSELTKKGWQHPKPFNHKDYLGRHLDHLPTSEEVKQANQTKNTVPKSNKTAEGRGDSDKYLTFDPDTDTGDEDEEDQYCDHCGDWTDHSSENCTTSKWCSVCEEHGDHTPEEEHEHCDHCNDYADHSTEECNENPDNWSKESYCPHCDTKDKNNEHSSECVNCGQKLPDWGDLQTHGKAVKPEEYREDGETDAANYGHAKDAKMSGSAPRDLASHLYHHHKSDVGGPEFDKAGDWDEDALKNHHQWLHMNPEHAAEKGFTVDHSHKQVYGEFKKNMTPVETHAHMLTSHTGPSQFSVGHVASMTPEEAVEAHTKAHMADDAVKWGQKDPSGDLVKKITHTHHLDEDPEVPGEENFPTGDKLVEHLANPAHHLSQKSVDLLKPSFEKNPGLADAIHKQMHANYGPTTEGGSKFHVHGEEFQKQEDQHAAVLHHLTHDHGVAPSLLGSGKNLDALITAHQQEHTSAFPKGDDPDHVHFGGVMHSDPDGHTAETSKKEPSQSEKIIQHLKEHHGATDDDLAHTNGTPAKLMKLHQKEHGKNPELDLPKHEHHGMDSIAADAEPATHTNDSMKSDEKFPELKSATVGDLMTANHGYGVEDHLTHHHPEVYKALQHAEGFDYGPGTPKFQQALQEGHEAHMKAHAEGADHDHGGTAKAQSVASDKPKIKLDSPGKNMYGPGSVMHHIQFEHAGSHLDDMANDVLDKAEGSGAAGTSYMEMAKAHKAYHQEHGHPGHTHYDNEPHPKEAARRTLTDLFKEVAL